MPSKVHFISAPQGDDPDLLAQRFSKLLEASKLLSSISPTDFVAIKFHFGEKGNVGHLKRPVIQVAVDKAKSLSKYTYVSDTNTLYRGQRANTVDHLKIAKEHGFSLESLGVPVIIADGLKGRSYMDIPVERCVHYKSIPVASDFVDTDVVVALTHVTGHCGTGMGASIKNIGMGCTARKAKLSMHDKVKPEVRAESCIRCGLCVRWCPADAIALGEKAAVIDASKCIGCGECTVLCRTGAIFIHWSESSHGLQEKLAESALGVMTAVGRRMVFFNFLTFVEKDCDCLGEAQKKAIDDIGILASTDPVAIDQASADLLNTQSGQDFFRSLFPSIDWTDQLSHGEKIGLGSRSYELIEVK